MLAGTLIIATAETIAGDIDLTRYAITQGGLLAVVLVLIYMMRRDAQRREAKGEEKATVLTDLVRANTAALTRAADATQAQQEATDRLAVVVDHLRNRT
jgi:uncharacterized protein YggE